MEQVTLKQVKVNQFFTLVPCEEPSEGIVWIRGNYNRSTKKYECNKFVDIYNFHEFSPNRIVFVDFIF